MEHDVEEVETLVKAMVLGLIDDPSSATFETIPGVGASVTFRVTLGNAELGKIIGKQGRTARAMRCIIAGVARKTGLIAQIDLTHKHPEAAKG